MTYSNLKIMYSNWKTNVLWCIYTYVMIVSYIECTTCSVIIKCNIGNSSWEIFILAESILPFGRIKQMQPHWSTYIHPRQANVISHFQYFPLLPISRDIHAIYIIVPIPFLKGNLLCCLWDGSSYNSMPEEGPIKTSPHPSSLTHTTFPHAS